MASLEDRRHLARRLLLLALGASFGFVAAVVAIAHAIWFRLPAGVAGADYVSLGRQTDAGVQARLSLEDFDAIRELAPDVAWFFAWDGLIGLSTDSLGGAPPEEYFDVHTPAGEAGVRIHGVSSDFFDILGVRAASGALRSPEAGKPVAVLSHALWRSHYGKKADIADDFLRMRDGPSIPIVGVAPEAFAGVLPGVRAQAWVLDAGAFLSRLPQIPLEMSEESLRRLHRKAPTVNIFGAVGGGNAAISAVGLRALLASYRFNTSSVVTSQAAGIVFINNDGSERHAPEQKVIGPRTTQETITKVTISWPFGISDADRVAVADGLETRPDSRRDALRRMIWLATIVALLLTLAFAALVDILMADNLARADEQRIRIAVGATPADMFRRTASGSALWIVAVAAVGGFFCVYLVDVLLGVEPFASYVGAASAASKGAGLACGALLLLIAFLASAGYVSARALRMSHAPAVSRMRESARLSRAIRGVLLLVAAANLLAVLSLVSRYADEASDSLGFRNSDALLISLISPAYADARLTRPTLQIIEDALEAIPGVRSVAGAMDYPLAGIAGVETGRVQLLNEPALAGTPFHEMRAMPAFFDTLGVDVLAGRVFGDRVQAECVISRSAAVSLAGTVEAALGKAVHFQPDVLDDFSSGGSTAMATVVGVVGDMPYGNYAAPVRRMIYRPLASTYIWPTVWLVHHRGDASAIVSAARQSPTFVGWTIEGLGTPAALFREQFAARRSVEILVSVAAAFALVLALAAVGSSLARTIVADREAVGVRLALGATPAALSFGYLGALLGDLLLAAAAVGAVALAAGFAAPELAELLDIWLLAPSAACLAAACALVCHVLIRRFSRRRSLSALMHNA